MMSSTNTDDQPVTIAGLRQVLDKIGEDLSKNLQGLDENISRKMNEQNAELSRVIAQQQEQINSIVTHLQNSPNQKNQMINEAINQFMPAIKEKLGLAPETASLIDPMLSKHLEKNMAKLYNRTLSAAVDATNRLVSSEIRMNAIAKKAASNVVAEHTPDV